MCPDTRWWPSRRDLFIPSLEVTNITFWFRFTRTHQPRKRAQTRRSQNCLRHMIWFYPGSPPGHCHHFLEFGWWFEEFHHFLFSKGLSSSNFQGTRTGGFPNSVGPMVFSNGVLGWDSCKNYNFPIRGAHVGNYPLKFGVSPFFQVAKSSQLSNRSKSFHHFLPAFRISKDIRWMYPRS